MRENRIRFEFEGRYYTIGSENNIKSVWFVLHGHGHLARFFLEKFRQLDDGQTLIVAPEGLNRYYQQGFSGNVGATWMTKEDRLTDIKNYVHFLDTVYAEVFANGSFKPERITFLGFSQGAATVSRWALQGKSDFHRLILWSGIFPPDMDFEKGNKLLSEKEVISIYGSNDEYLTREAWNEQIMLEKKLGIETEKVKFEGGHEVDQEALKELK